MVIVVSVAWLMVKVECVARLRWNSDFSWVISFPVIFPRFRNILKPFFQNSSEMMTNQSPINFPMTALTSSPPKSVNKLHFSDFINPRFLSFEQIASRQIIIHMVHSNLGRCSILELYDIEHQAASWLLLLKQQGNRKGSKLLLNSTRSCKFKRPRERRKSLIVRMPVMAW